MLRFRNRFRDAPMPSDVAKCKACGLHVTHSFAADRETFIHELPWCDTFREFISRAAAEPGVQLHMAVGNVTDRETLIIADGESIADIDQVPA